MSGFKRVESTFAPIPDALRTMYPVEATVTISKQKGTPGVNLKIKINDMDENGQPQQNAGRSFFKTFWLTEKTFGMYCQFLDALGFKTDDEGNYLLEDGSIMPDPTTLPDGTVLPYLIGVPFLAETKGKENTWDKEDGSKGSNVQYDFKYQYKDRKPVLSVIPKKAEAYAVNAPLQEATSADFGNGGFGDGGGFGSL